MKGIAGVSLVMALTFPALVTASAAESRFHYHYYKQSVPLVEETGSVAVFDEAQGPPEDLAHLLDRAGFRDPDLRSFHGRGWSIARIRSASDALSVSGVAPAISRLLDLDWPRRYFFSPVFAGSDGGPVVVTPTVLVRFESGVSEAGIRQVLASAGAGGVKREPFGGMANAFRLTTGYRSGIAVLDLANRLAQLPEVRLAEPDMIFTGRSGSVPPSVYEPEPLPMIPNDPEFPNCWGLHNTGQFPGSVEDVDIDAPEAWTFTTGNPAVIVVVIDVGVDQGHLDINQAPGNDFTNEPGAVRDGGPVNVCDNHGTAVAGVATAIINNSRGTVGVAPGARIASARAMKSIVLPNGNCPGTFDAQFQWTVDALEWAESIGARITNNSNFYNMPSGMISDKYQETRDNGMIHFAIAGNDSSAFVRYPGSLPSVNAVSAITWSGDLAAFSNWGPEVAFTAPGYAIFTTDRSGVAGYSVDDITIGFGTSFAAPMLAGSAALLLSHFPALTVERLEGYLELSAIDLGPHGVDEFFGNGLANAHIALKVAAIEAIFMDGFESGDVSAWSATE
jgi:hypothetical protein